MGHEKRPGNLRARTGNMGFMGEKHRMTCRLSRTLSMKNWKMLAVFSCSSGRSLMKAPCRSAVIARTSSFAKSPAMLPVMSTVLIFSKKVSSLISESVKRKVVGCRFHPALRYLGWEDGCMCED